MAVIYLRSGDGDDGSDGSTWALAKATLAAALTAAGAGGTVYVSDNHAETTAAAITLASPGTAANPVTILCVDDAGDPEPPTALATTATVATTGNASHITVTGFAYSYGVSYTAGSSTLVATIQWNSVAAWWWKYEACELKIGNTSTSSTLSPGVAGGNSDDNLLELVNVSLEFGATAQNVTCRCPVRWTNTNAVAGIQGTVPTTLFNLVTAVSPGFLDVYGVDLSAAGSGKNLVLGSAAIFARINFENCKLGASVTLINGVTAGQGGIEVRVVNCDSADTNYRYSYQTYQGTITQDIATYRSGGASDGTTGVSRKMVATANTKFYSPLVSDPIIVWNETLGSVTATVEVITDNVTLTDAEAWIEVEYLGTSGFPLSSFSSDRATNFLTTPANQTSSSVTWTTGIGTPIKQKLSTTFTPAEKGPIKVRVMYAKASGTMYFCPKVDIT